jgi:hypothetical protein
MIPHYISEENAPILVCAGATDILLGNDILFSDKNPPVGDYILSKKRTAIARFQSDGNFVVYTGLFNENGTPIGKQTPIWASNNATGMAYVFNGLPGPFKMIFNQGLTVKDMNDKLLVEIFKLPQYIPGAQLMTITDDGNLIYTIAGKPVWSVFPLAQQTATTTTTSNTTTGNVSTSEFSINKYILPIGAALVGLYFFLKK